jgi:hypothetical protein
LGERLAGKSSCKEKNFVFPSSHFFNPCVWGVGKSPDVSVDFGFGPMFFEDCLGEWFIVAEYMGYVFFSEYFIDCYACSTDAGE